MMLSEIKQKQILYDFTYVKLFKKTTGKKKNKEQIGGCQRSGVGEGGAGKWMKGVKLLVIK